jgi:hypothetical protein
MARHSLISTGLLGFGMGLVVGSGFRRSTHFAAGMCERFGFELDEMIWSFWESKFVEDSAPVKRVEERQTQRPVARVVVRREVKRRAFSNVAKRPGSLTLVSA